MIEKIREGIANLNYNELKILEIDLKKGAPTVKTIIKNRIKQIESQDTGLCAGCGNVENLSYTLIFGPDDFKKKASFCGLDCLEYFLEQLKEINK